ncbi:MAG: hypothetical protein CVV48_06005 [Spirochaetae bacterium HGW-Spirochaetae-4]|nr:MAG: hypothetical protein A2Y31_11840 [Spirochaetes bacterium GWC2_52_13]PKL21770.1 MAG: hypothetical protein CVV48_06005 [Spirochaetae bacterium HGW-Spirochaetae-4]HCG63358.1 hypothetical protein [Sphaerochaeta sp.]HCS36506.1 hypothetical protein [Sphaerochaeta sp.]
MAGTWLGKGSEKKVDGVGIKTGKQISSSAVMLAVASLAFFFMGFSDVLKGSAVAEMVGTLGVDYALGGSILGITYFGFFAGTLSSVSLLKRFAVARLLVIAVATTALGVILFGFANHVSVILFATFLTGGGCGLIDVSANLTVRLAARPEQVGRELNRLAFFHGFGSIVSPLFAAMVLNLYSDWHMIYRVAAILLVAATFAVSKGVSSSNISTRIPYEKDDRLVLNLQVVLLGGFLFWYMTLETGIAGWLVAYARQAVGLSDRVATSYLSLFFIMLTIGRFLGSWYVDKVGLLRTIVIHVVALLVITTVSALFPRAHILLPLSGFLMAPLFPTTVALLVNELGTVGLRTTGIFFSIAGLGGLFGPWIIGMVSRAFSLRFGFGLLAIFATCFLCLTLIYRVKRKVV